MIETRELMFAVVVDIERYGEWCVTWCLVWRKATMYRKRRLKLTSCGVSKTDASK
jgi:hypothetical protein